MSFSNPMMYVGFGTLICVVVILAIVGPKLKHSPWLYVAAFGLMSCVGILAIRGKFEQRQRGIENKYIGRQETAKYFANQNGEAKDTAAKTSTPEVENGTQENRNASRPVYQYPSNENAKTVNFLLVVSVLATLVGTVMLIVEFRNNKSTDSIAI